MLSTKTTHNRYVFTFDAFPATPMHVEHENTPSLVCFRVRYLFFTSGKVLNTNTHPRWCVFAFGTFLATTTQRGRSSSPFLSHPPPLHRSNAIRQAWCNPSPLLKRRRRGSLPTKPTLPPSLKRGTERQFCPTLTHHLPYHIRATYSLGCRRCFFVTSPAVSLDIYIILNTYTYNII